MNQTTLIEAYSRLKALKGNLPDRHTVSERYIVEFHSILDQLMKISQVNLNNFRVLSSEIHPDVTRAAQILSGFVFSAKSIGAHRTYAYRVHRATTCLGVIKAVTSDK